MKQRFNQDLGPWILRTSLGVVLLAHSVYLKLAIFSLPGTAAYFDSIGLPGVLAYGVFAIEAVAGLALLLGYRPRLAAASVLPVLLGATWAHWPAGWLFTNANGGWEYPLFLSAVALAVAVSGAGHVLTRSETKSQNEASRFQGAHHHG